MAPSLKRCAAFAVAAVVSAPASAQGIVTQKKISLALAHKFLVSCLRPGVQSTVPCK